MVGRTKQPTDEMDQGVRRCISRPIICINWHELRGGSLDHERRDMNEHRETIRADVDQVIPHVAEDSAAGRVEKTRSFSQKIYNANFL